MRLAARSLLDDTKGHLFSARKNWQSARSMIQKHARATYAANGLPLTCLVCGYNKHVEIAHRKAVSDFAADTTIRVINDITNLMALCPNHHWEQEHTDLIVPQGQAPESNRVSPAYETGMEAVSLA